MKAVDVVVLGLGFTGLPMAVAAAKAGARVVGLDSSTHRVSEIVQARPGAGLTTVPEGLLRELLSDGRLHICATTAYPPAARTHVVCVQTPPGPGLDPDLTALFAAVDLVAARLRPDDLVLVQSTCPPGTVESLLASRLAAGSGLRPGADFFLAHSPVRTDPGRPGPNGVPRVVGGMSARCTAAATRFLTGLAERVVPVDSIGTAELVKVFENTFRLVNISLVNELADLCRAFEVNVHEVLDAASTKPFGFLRHRPSPGAGGDCIPASARFFAAAAQRHARSASIARAALAVNDATPARTASLVLEWWSAQDLPPLRKCRVLVSGVTYKPDVPSTRRSAAVRVLEHLRTETEIGYHDPYIPQLELSDGTVLHSQPLSPDAADVVLVLSRHSAVDVAGHGLPVVDCSSGQPRLLGS
ncbi:MAG TPA: nucleotide sugar dehydrogenase [Actinophytocola sp.]|nr:nucleotide sugar dehydrogenase [Actinophytocola sp.]